MSTFKVSAAALARAHGKTTQVGCILVTNLADAARYLKLWDAGTVDDVTLGTTPPDIVIPLAAGATFYGEPCATFNKGLVVGVTTGAPDTDNTLAADRDVVGVVSYGLPGSSY